MTTLVVTNDDVIVFGIRKDTTHPVPSIKLPKTFDSCRNPSKAVLSIMEGYYNQDCQTTQIGNFYISPELLHASFFNERFVWYNRCVLRQNERLCMIWAPKLDVGKKINNQFFCYLISSYEL